MIMGKYFTIIGLLFLAFQSEGAHIVGGDLNYTFLRFNNDTTEVTFRFTINMYRDEFSGGAPFDPDAEFGIYRENADGSWTYLASRFAAPAPVDPIPSIDNPCIEEPTNVGVEATFYSFDFTFDIINFNYQIAWQRCCRNNTITNIRIPGDTGAAFNISISPEAQILGNSSPIFNDFPPLFLCANEEFTFDDSATDPDGDLLRYRFCAPFEAGGIDDAGEAPRGCCNCVRPDPDRCTPPFGTVEFIPPFTATAPLGGNPVVQIDNTTGIIFGAPDQIGQYVVGVCVEEYRNGQLIGTVFRDFQFNIITCQNSVIAQFNDYEIIPPLDPDDDCQTFDLTSCGINSINIINDSQLEANIFSYHWIFIEDNGDLVDEINGGPEFRDVEITFPDIGRYEGMMIINEGTDCADTACFQVNIFPDINADFQFDLGMDPCRESPIEFEDLSETGADDIVEWSWDFKDGNVSTLEDPIHQYDQPGLFEVLLTVTDNNGCTDQISKQIEYFPVPDLLVVEPSKFIGCAPGEIFFDNLSTPIDETYTLEWDFGDGGESGEISPTYVYNETGSFDVFLKITSPEGCETEESFPNLVTLLDSPQADFSFTPEEPNNFTESVNFTDESIDAGGWQWEFGDLGSSLSRNPSYAFPDTGTYEVLLVAFHPITGCPDSITKIVDVRPLGSYFVPNAFTPNNDGKNDVFKGKGFFQVFSDFSMQIFNRWGEMVYLTEDPREGWNGQVNNSGPFSPVGVYVYKIQYLDARNELKNLEGHLTLLR